jgi:hypothetical protein
MLLPLVAQARALPGLDFRRYPQNANKGKAPAAQVGLGGIRGLQSSNQTCKAQVREATGEDSE